MNEEIKRIFNEFLPKGIIRRYDFLGKPELMIKLLDALTGANSSDIIDCYLWKYLEDENPDQIIQLLVSGVEDYKYNYYQKRDENNLSEIEMVRDYIKNYLPEDAQLVSFIYDDLEIGKYIFEYSKRKGSSCK
jgi:hypothetical protein